MKNVVTVLMAAMDLTAVCSVAHKLVALAQSRQASDDDNIELSAPAAVAYANHSSDIVDVLNDLMDKAHTQLDETRHAALLQQCLEDQPTQVN